MVCQATFAGKPANATGNPLVSREVVQRRQESVVRTSGPDEWDDPADLAGRSSKSLRSQFPDAR